MDNDELNPNAVDCTELACTENFVTLIVSIKDASGASVALDRFVVLDEDSSENITLALSNNGLEVARQNGEYPLYDDSFVSENQNTERTLVFSGFINDEKVVEAVFIIATDCCHVSIDSGNTDIIVN